MKGLVQGSTEVTDEIGRERALHCLLGSRLSDSPFWKLVTRLGMHGKGGELHAVLGDVGDVFSS